MVRRSIRMHNLIAFPAAYLERADELEVAERLLNIGLPGSVGWM